MIVGGFCTQEEVSNDVSRVVNWENPVGGGDERGSRPRWSMAPWARGASKDADPSILGTGVNVDGRWVDVQSRIRLGGWGTAGRLRSPARTRHVGCRRKVSLPPRCLIGRGRGGAGRQIQARSYHRLGKEPDQAQRRGKATAKGFGTLDHVLKSYSELDFISYRVSCLCLSPAVLGRKCLFRRQKKYWFPLPPSSCSNESPASLSCPSHRIGLFILVLRSLLA